MRHILIRPLINEKSMGLTEGGFYTFEVGKSVTKDLVAKVVAEKFKVKTLSVRIVNLKGKRKMQRSRKGYFVTSGVKKAIVKLEKGQKIALFEQAVAAEEEVEVKTAEGSHSAKASRDKEVVVQTKEKKSFLRGTKVKIEKTERPSSAKATEGERGQEDLKTSHKEAKKGGK